MSSCEVLFFRFTCTEAGVACIQGDGLSCRHESYHGITGKLRSEPSHWIPGRVIHASTNIENKSWKRFVMTSPPIQPFGFENLIDVSMVAEFWFDQVISASAWGRSYQVLQNHFSPKATRCFSVETMCRSDHRCRKSNFEHKRHGLRG